MWRVLESEIGREELNVKELVDVWSHSEEVKFWHLDVGEGEELGKEFPESKRWRHCGQHVRHRQED